MAIVVPGQETSGSTPENKKIVLNAHEKLMLKEARENKSILVAAYGEGRSVFAANTNRTTFMDFILNYLTEHFGWDKGRIQHREEMYIRLYPSLITHSDDPVTNRPKGIINLLASYMQQKDRKDGVKTSDMEESAEKIRKISAVLTQLQKNTKGQESAEWKQFLAQETALKIESSRTPDVRCRMKLAAAIQNLKDLQENYNTKVNLIKTARIGHGGAFYVPERESKNLTVRIAKQFDDNLGAGGIDFSQFDL